MAWYDDLLRAYMRGGSGTVGGPNRGPIFQPTGQGGAIGMDQTSPMAGDTFGFGSQMGSGPSPIQNPAIPPQAGVAPPPVDDPAVASAPAQVSGGLPGGGGAPLAQQPGSMWSRLSAILQNPAVQQSAGQIVSMMGDKAAADRNDRYDTQGIDMRRLQETDYLASGGSDYTPKAGLPSYGFGPKKTSETVSQQAEQTQSDIIERLQKGTAPSFWEQLANIAGPSLTAVGAARQPKQPVPGKKP